MKPEHLYFYKYEYLDKHNKRTEHEETRFFVIPAEYPELVKDRRRQLKSNSARRQYPIQKREPSDTFRILTKARDDDRNGLITGRLCSDNVLSGQRETCLYLARFGFFNLFRLGVGS